MGLTPLTLKRPKTTLMIVVGLIVAGFFSLSTLPVQLNPEVSFPLVSVQTEYPGAGSEEVDTEVSRRLEDALSGASGLRVLTSTSQEGNSLVLAEFRLGTDTDAALNDIRARVDTVAADLPKDAKRPRIEKFSTAAEPVAVIGVSADNLKPRELRTLVNKELADRFRRLPGVGNAVVSGGEVREIQVHLSPERLQAHGLGILDIQRQLEAASVNVPAGQVDNGEREFSLRVPAQLSSSEELQAVRITIPSADPTKPPASVRLGDLASIRESSAVQRQFTRLAGSPAVLISVTKTREGNTVEILDNVKEAIKRVRADYADRGLRVELINDNSTEVRGSLSSLGFDIAFAVVLVVATVYLFLHNKRGALIVAIAIPICLMVSITVLKLLGQTLNNMSMIGLIMAIAVLVDDAIVVLENIYRHLRNGEEPAVAAIKGRSEIGMAAIAITLADVVVFLPIAFMGGVLGLWMKPLAITFVVAVVVSLLVSFTITPLLASRWYRAGEDLEHPKGRFGQGFERLFQSIILRYEKSLGWALYHRWTVFLTGNLALLAVGVFIAAGYAKTPDQAAETALVPVAITLFVGLVAAVVTAIRRGKPGKVILAAVGYACIFGVAASGGYAFGGWKQDEVFKFSFLPPSEQNQIWVRVELPVGTSISRTEKVVARIESAIQGHPAVRNVVSNVGQSGETVGTNIARIDVGLYEKASLKDDVSGKTKKENLRRQPATEIAFDLQKRIGRIPDTDIQIAPKDPYDLGAPIQISLQGRDEALLAETANRLRDELRNGAVPGVIAPELSSKPGKPELKIRLDRDRLGDLQLDAASTALAVRTLYEGDDNLRVRRNGEEFRIRLQMPDEARRDRDQLKDMPLTFISGKPILVGSVADIVYGQATDRIDRRDRAREIQLRAFVLPGYASGSAQAAVDSWLKVKGRLPDGVRVTPLGEADHQNQEAANFVAALVIGFFLVYMLLVSLYENLLYPLIIQLSQPQAMVGALMAMVLWDKTFNLISFIGVVALVGLVGKNAILLVDYTNTLRKEGRPRTEAIIEAAGARLKPIVMTTLALLLGMLPIALAIGRGSEFRETIGVVILGGTALSTGLTLFVIPCSYSLFDDLVQKFGSRSALPSPVEVANE